jgi:hypothetical protein
MQRPVNHHTWMFRFASKVVLGFLWACFGFWVVCMLAQMIGLFGLVEMVWSVVGAIVWRAIGVMLCVVVAGLVVESAQ